MPCSACLSEFSNDDFITCTNISCNKSFHTDTTCMGGKLPEDKSSWLCPKCRCSIKIVGDNSHVPCSPEVSNVTLRKSIPQADIQKLFAEIRLLRSDVLSLGERLNTVSASITACLNRMDSAETRLAVLEKGSAETLCLKQEICELKTQMNSQEQLSLRNEIEVCGVPELENENPHHIAMVIAAKLGVKLAETDIDWSARAGPKRAKSLAPRSHEPNQSTREVPKKHLPRPLVIRLIRRCKRDELLVASRSRRGLTSTDLEFSGSSENLFFNERLTKINRLLFRQTRLRTSSTYKYRWLSNGVILVRKREGTPAIPIRSMEDLEALVGPFDEQTEK